MAISNVVDGPNMAQTAWVRSAADVLAGRLDARITQLQDVELAHGDPRLREYFSCIGLRKALDLFERKLAGKVRV